MADIRALPLHADQTDSLEALESLKDSITRGEIVSFVAVGIQKDDGLVMWIGNSGKAKSLLQMIGAVDALQRRLHEGDFHG